MFIVAAGVTPAVEGDILSPGLFSRKRVLFLKMTSAGRDAPAPRQAGRAPLPIEAVVIDLHSLSSHHKLCR